jgi:signal transduction histidine kinase
VQIAFALALAASFAAHAAVSWAVSGYIDGLVLIIDGALLLLALAAWTVHSQQLARDRRRHVVTQELAAAFAAPRDVRETAATVASLFVDAGLASAALVAVARTPAGGTGDLDSWILTPVARVGFPAEEADDDLENSVASSAFSRLSVERELPAADRWLFALGSSLGTRPLVARMPLQRGDELLGALLLVSPQAAGPLSDRRLLETTGALVSAALDNARLYEATFEQTRDLEVQDARRREFLYAISHELRTPLTSIRAFAELLTEQRASRTRRRARADGRVDDEEQLFASLARGVDRLSYLVEDLLRLGRAEEVSEDLEITPLDAPAALEAAATIIRPAVMQRGQTLHLDLPTEVVAVFGEQRALEQVLINLLSNANRHTPEGGTIEARVETREDDIVRFEVSDSGPGIAIADRERIFEPFFRVRRAGAQVPGSGLGLAVARRSVDQLGGRLWVEDTVEGRGGARFCVELPAAPATAIPDAPSVRAASPSSPAKRAPRGDAASEGGDGTGGTDSANGAQQLHLDLHERTRTPL